MKLVRVTISVISFKVLVILIMIISEMYLLFNALTLYTLVNFTEFNHFRELLVNEY